MKKPDRLFQVDRAGRRKDQGPKPHGPPGHPGTEFLALPDNWRRPVRIRIVGPVGVQLELTVAIVAVEVRHVRPVGKRL